MSWRLRSVRSVVYVQEAMVELYSACMWRLLCAWSHSFAACSLLASSQVGFLSRPFKSNLARPRATPRAVPRRSRNHSEIISVWGSEGEHWRGRTCIHQPRRHHLCMRIWRRTLSRENMYTPTSPTSPLYEDLKENIGEGEHVYTNLTDIISVWGSEGEHGWGRTDLVFLLVASSNLCFSKECFFSECCHTINDHDQYFSPYITCLTPKKPGA